MSDSQTVWTILWEHAARNHKVRDPFEISDVVPQVAAVLKVSEAQASRLIAGLLKELDRLPDGKRFFTLEGNAVVPLPSFVAALDEKTPALAAYPYEL